MKRANKQRESRYIRRSERNNHWTKHVQIYLSLYCECCFTGIRFFSLLVRSFRLARKQHNRQKQSLAIASSKPTKQASKQSYAYQCIIAIQNWRFIECVSVSVLELMCVLLLLVVIFKFISYVLSCTIFFLVFVFFVLPLFQNANAGFIYLSF